MMLRVELFDTSFDAVKKVLAEVYPSIKVKHIATDEKLKELGFVDYSPCVFLMDTDWDGFQLLMDELIQIEVDAFNTSDGMDPPEDDPYYLRFLEYGWLWDILFNADERGDIVEVTGHVLHDTVLGKEVMINEDGSASLKWEFFYERLESGKMINEIYFSFTDGPEDDEHYLGYIEGEDKPYWIGYCDIDGGCEFSSAAELVTAPVFNGKSLKDRWEKVVIWSIVGICVEDWVKSCI